MKAFISIVWAIPLMVACSNSNKAGGVAAGTGGTVGAFEDATPGAADEVTSLVVLASDGEVTLRWKDPADDPTLASIEVSTLGASAPSSVGKGVETATIGGLKNRTPYVFVVRTVDSSGAKSLGTAIGARADFVKVQGGTFQQGTADSTVKASYPAHPVTLSSFYIGKYEVTFTEYDEFADVTGRPLPSDGGWGRGSRPVRSVSWYSAVAYANWRSTREGLETVYTIDENTPDPRNVTSDSVKYLVTPNGDANGYRLPTEAEWEFAAIGGTLSHGYKFSGSDTIIDVGWSGADTAAGINGAASTHPVGTKLPNELGLYDFTGNIVEFTGDAALSTNTNNYTADAQTNPTGPDGDYDRRVVRGGGPHASETCSTNVARHFLSPTRECMVGIRLARSVKGATP